MASLVGSSLVFANAAMMLGLAERIRAEVEALTFDEALSDLQVTISVGVALRTRGEDAEAFFARADAALYEAKQSGRNRVAVAAGVEVDDASD